MTRVLLALALALLTRPAHAADDPAALLARAAAQQTATNSVQQVRLTSVSRSGTEKVRELRIQVRVDGDVVRTRGQITAPDNLAGTTFILVDRPGADAELLLYLSALKSVTQVSGSGRGDAFLGTDFSYADLEIPDPAQARHQVVEDRADAWLVESVPTAGTSPYAFVRTTLDKGSGRARQIEYLDAGHNVLKRLEIFAWDGPLPTRLQMSDVAKGSRTLLEVTESRTGVPASELPLTLFERSSLEAAEPAPGGF